MKRMFLVVALLLLAGSSSAQVSMIPKGGSGSGSGDALKADPLSQFAATTCAQFAGVISSETGSCGAVVLSQAPVFGGTVSFGTASTSTGILRLLHAGHAFFNDIQQSATQGASITYTLPIDDGGAGEVLSTDGSGVLDWVAAGGGVTIGDTQVAYATSANTLGGDAGLIYDDTTDTLTATNIGAFTSTGRITLPVGSVSAVPIGWAANTGFYARATSVVNVATGGVGSIEFNAGNMHLITTAQLKWGVALNSCCDLGLTRDVAGVLRVSNGTSGIGAHLFARNVEAVTTTKQPGAAESFEVYTNTGDADGATLTLTNDPGVGLEFKAIITAAQTLTIVADTGESLYANGAVCATSLTSATVGSAVTITAAVGGSGGIWVASYTGTWSCT